jgi:hypothetical protein
MTSRDESCRAGNGQGMLVLFIAVIDSAENFYRRRRQRLHFFCRYRRQRKKLHIYNQNFKIFGLVPTHIGLICVKTLEPNISSLGPFK